MVNLNENQYNKFILILNIYDKLRAIDKKKTNYNYYIYILSAYDWILMYTIKLII